MSSYIFLFDCVMQPLDDTGLYTCSAYNENKIVSMEFVGAVCSYKRATPTTLNICLLSFMFQSTPKG